MYKFNFRTILNPILALQLAMSPLSVYANEKQITARTATDDTKTDSNTKTIRDRPPWLEDLSDRFSFIGNGLKLIDKVTDIDAIVGNDPNGNNPWTLRADTAGAIKFLPVKIQSGVSNYFLGNIGQIVTKDHNFNSVDQGNLPTQLYTNRSMSADFTLTDQMMNDLANSALIKQLQTFLSEEQLIDYGVYLLTKAPFFPKQNDPGAWEYWEKVKYTILYYDIYIIIAVITAALLFDKAQLQISGYLFKVKGDTFRIGWYGGLKNLGAHLNGTEFKTGLKARAENLETRLGVVKKLEPHEKTLIEGMVISKIISQLLKPRGWDSEASVNVTHYLSDQISPTNEGQTFFGFNSTLKKDNLREGNSLSLTLQNSAALSSSGRPSASTSGIIADEKYGVDASFKVSASPETINGKDTYNFQVGFIGSYQWDGGAKGLKKSIESDADAIRSALYKIEDLQSQEQTQFVKMTIAAIRVSLKVSYNSYLNNVKKMMGMFPRPEERFFPLTDKEIGLALIEIEKGNNVEIDEKTSKLLERLHFHN